MFYCPIFYTSKISPRSLLKIIRKVEKEFKRELQDGTYRQKIKKILESDLISLSKILKKRFESWD